MTSVRSIPNPAVVGQTVTLVATVTPASGSIQPGGTVVFKDGATTIGTGTLNMANPDGAGVSTSFSVAGVHQITAAYGGDSNFIGSTSPEYDLYINTSGVQTTTLILNISVSNPTRGQPANTVHLRQTISVGVQVSESTIVCTFPSCPTGNVRLLDNNIALPKVIQLGGTSAFQRVTFAGIQLGLGRHSIVANYQGNSQFGGPYASSFSSATILTGTPKPR